VDGVPDFRAGGIVLIEPFEGVGGHHGAKLHQNARAGAIVQAPLNGKKRKPKDDDGDFVGVEILDASTRSLEGIIRNQFAQKGLRHQD
jgi:hypothetical protein